jgi:predicted enzyme involved in methoxymalonyl-ACP biosynthesis
VGFVSVLKSDNGYELTDFVMSCRVAQKKVERAFFNWLIGTFADGDSLYINVHKTDRNTPLRDELKKMPFDVVIENDEKISFKYKYTRQPFADDKIIRVKEQI